MFRRRLETRDRSSKKDTGRRIRELFSRHSGESEKFYDDLEDILVEADFGAAAGVELVNELRDRQRSSPENWSRDRYTDELKDILRPSLVRAHLDPPEKGLAVYLVLGVNGVGKTTTIAKMAHRFINDGKGPVSLAAADTFRAGAVEQLGIYAHRVGARLVKQDHLSDPGAVVYDALTSALGRGERIVIADTAGRMHNRANLVKQLAKIDRIARERLNGEGVYRKILVIDATTGQNGMRQAETFHEAIGVDAVVMTKYDSSAKGGLVAADRKRIRASIRLSRTGGENGRSYSF